MPLLNLIKRQFLTVIKIAVFFVGALPSIRSANVALNQLRLTEWLPCDLNLEGFLGYIRDRGKFCSLDKAECV